MNITPKNMDIRSLFQSSFYKIPRFQRPYSWDKGNIEDFWNDAIESGNQGYFIGSMVLYGSKGAQDLFVVDGQQRLTTITIFLAALRDTLVAVGEPALANGIQNIIQRPDIASNLRFVLLTETSFPYLQEYVQKLGAPELKIVPRAEEKGIQQAYDYARAGFGSMVAELNLSSKSPSSKKTAIRRRLEKVRDALLSLDIIVVQLDNEDDAYIVFETLNTRGKDLEAKDLIKNLLTRLLPAKGSDVDPAKISWKNVMDSIEQSAASIDPSTYLHHFWLSKYDYTPERTLYKRVKDRIDKDTASEFLAELETDVVTYRRIFEPDNFKWAKEEIHLQQSLMALAIFKVRQPTPLILSLLRAYYNNRISLKQAKDVITSVERFHFLHTAIAGASSSGGVSMMYAAAARELSSENNDQKRAKYLQDFRAKLRGRLPEADIFHAGFGELRYSKSEARARPLVRYVLTKADRLLRAGDAPVDYDKMTIEHIAPQSPKGGGSPIKGYADIGNLILVSEELNQALENKGFPEKKALMTAAGIPLDPILSAADANWSSDEISARTKAMSDLIYAAESGTA